MASKKISKSEYKQCPYENKNVTISWIEVTLGGTSLTESIKFSCNRLLDCQTKYGSIDNIPQCLIKNRG